MIVTVTPNPSIDRTVTLAAPLTRGAVHRVSSVTSEPGGKGVNVARALTLAGLEAVALLPAPANDPLVAALQASAVPFRCVPTTDPVRTNLAITEHDGTTTKLNEPGAALDAAALDALTRSVVASAETASWVVLSGSLPPGVPDGWYADVVALLAPYACRVAIDTSERPLAALVDSFDRAAPDLIKPNAEELAGVLGFSPHALEAAVAQGDPRTRRIGGPPAGGPRRSRGARHVRSRRRRAGRRDRQPGWPPRLRSCRAAPSARATRPWPDTSAPKWAGPFRHSDSKWRSPTAAPPPHCPDPPCPRPRRSTSMPFG